MGKESKHLLARLKEQREKLNARIQAAEARTKVTEKKQETRKKILVGSYYLDKAVKENKIATLKEVMDKFLTRNSDRILFDLQLLDNDSK